MYRVDLGFNEYVEFKTLDEAMTFCDEVFYKTREILSIEKVTDER